MAAVAENAISSDDKFLHHFFMAVSSADLVLGVADLHTPELVVAAEATLVDMVIILVIIGQMGVFLGHVTTIAKLNPSIMLVHESSEVTKYFISSGFAFIHANSVADAVAIKAVPVDYIDPHLIQKGFAEFTQKLSSASTYLEKAKAQMGVDVHSALNSAITR
ncbi:ATP synthase subunit delta', mitochondrial-like [Magnolia sinica]|uniref:ATP synthase subunit delta', mitochondrial-like n=1 Tax=Magnolia sinica TaxID=86752 RepID=UPI00265A4F6E|nr:ATP synthase subunit delta', mitochondrial-like [Magnolia sinica]